MSKAFLELAVCVLAVAAFAERQPIERYQSIIDRQMFGALPPGFDPTKSPSEVQKRGSKAEAELTKEQEQVKKAVRFSVINVTQNGETAVGFTDLQDPKVPRHYYLKVGETCDGWHVKEADVEERTMTVVKGEIEVTLTLGTDSASAPGAVKNAANAAARSQRSPLLGAGARFSSLRQRREQRRLQEQAEREEQRLQLQQIQEEIRKVREDRAHDKNKDKDDSGASAEEAPE